jgi:ubiquinone/menaquinone biosynthesis C-methylase UbiE
VAPFLRKTDPHALAVAMTTVKMGDQLLHVGCADGSRMGAIAVKVGLSGRAVAVVPDEDSAVRAKRGAAEAGAFVDVHMAPLTKLPFEDEGFDLAIVDDTGGLLATLRPEARVALVRETARVLKPRGRVIVIGAVPRGGLGAIFTRVQSGPSFDAQPSLEADGFRFVRLLGEREGLKFVEGLKA